MLSSSSLATAGIASTSFAPLPLLSVEWGPRHIIQNIQSNIQPPASHFVFPDLSQIFSESDRINFFRCTTPSTRIQTIATCRHSNHQSLIEKVVADVEPSSKILLVGGNDKTATTMSTVQAVKILQNEVGSELWGVANPNDSTSVASVELKVEAGIHGLITQPLLSSHSQKTLADYKGIDSTLVVIAGMAFPTSTKSLQFWAKLLGQEHYLSNDTLFQSHLAFFSQQNFTPLSWHEKHLQDLLLMMDLPSDGGNEDSSYEKKEVVINGLHCMPLNNIEDLCTILRSLKTK